MKQITEEQRLKYAAARQLGLLERLSAVGWAGLSAQETGRIGGLVGAMKRRGKEG